MKQKHKTSAQLKFTHIPLKIVVHCLLCDAIGRQGVIVPEKSFERAVQMLPERKRTCSIVALHNSVPL
jgi:hypothetical protein